ncbi:MAG: hypothetical protein A2041_12860 [Bacteroidetes bacterium GWA2_31_9b]|nr:MAG: hypothetical protein A2041_12860 [Bacteroidetes bacterium GWA2_31_9b]
MNKNLLKIFFLLFSLFLMINCSDDQCNQTTESILKTRMFVSDPSLISGKFLDSMSVYAPEWTDSIHHVGTSSTDSTDFSLYLSPYSDTTTFILASKSMLDTVHLFYTRKLILLSQECGFVTHFNIKSFNYTTNNIDSVFLIENEITTDNDGYLQIYF